MNTTTIPQPSPEDLAKQQQAEAEKRRQEEEHRKQRILEEIAAKEKELRKLRISIGDGNNPNIIGPNRPGDHIFFFFSFCLF